jgi:hypothetical protein
MACCVLWYQRLTALFGAFFACTDHSHDVINQYFRLGLMLKYLLILMVFAAKRKSNLAAVFLVYLPRSIVKRDSSPLYIFLNQFDE